MSEIIDFFKAKEKYGKKNKENEPTLEPATSKSSKLISFNAIENEKTKNEIGKFSDKDELRENISSLILKSTCDKIALYFDTIKPANPNEDIDEFMASKNGDDIVKGALVMMNLAHACPQLNSIFISTDAIFDNAMEAKLGKDAASIVMDEKINQKADDVIFKFEKQGKYEHIVNDIFGDADRMISIWENCTDEKKLIEELEAAQNIVTEAAKQDLTSEESYLVLSKMLGSCLENIAYTERIAYRQAGGKKPISEEDFEVYSHQSIPMQKATIMGLIKQFGKNDEVLNKSNPELKADTLSMLHPFLNRCNSCVKNKFFVDTYELETDFLYNIVKHAPHQLTAFGQFLAENNIQLPLNIQKMYTYMPAITKEFDDKFINKIFAIENGGSLLRSGTFNPKKYRKEHGIVFKETE